MNKIFFIVFIGAIAIAGCKKDDGTEPVNTKSFPFENSTLKMEVVSTTIPSIYIWDMHFLDEATGIVITHDGMIYKTTDRGSSWTLKYTNSNSDQPFNQVMFVDQNVGYVVGGASWCSGTGCTCPGGLVLKTTDGGESWVIIYQQTGAIEFKWIAANNQGDLFLNQKGFSGPAQPVSKILKSSDRGSTWTIVADLNYQLQEITFNNNLGFCTGNDDAGAIILRSNDNGNTWNNTTVFPELWTTDIAFSSNVGYCLANNRIVYKTVDNGDTWTQAFSSDYSTYKIDALTASSCLLWGSGPYTGGCFEYHYGAVRQTTNAGSEWTENQFKDIGGIRCTSFYSSTEGYVMAGELIKVTVKSALDPD